MRETGDLELRAGGRESSSLALPFVWVERPDDFRDDAALVVRIPQGIRSKQKLLAILADKLRLPGYFGGNWDALEECLRDLSWLPAGARVAIVHRDLPFGAGGESRGVYLSILASACAAASTGHPLTIVFPAALAPVLHSAMSSEPASAT